MRCIMFYNIPRLIALSAKQQSPMFPLGTIYLADSAFNWNYEITNIVIYNSQREVGETGLYRKKQTFMRGSRGRGGRWSGPLPLPMRNHQNIGFLRDSGPDHLEITKLPSQHSMSLSSRQRNAI